MPWVKDTAGLRGNLTRPRRKPDGFRQRSVHLGVNPPVLLQFQPSELHIQKRFIRRCQKHLITPLGLERLLPGIVAWRASSSLSAVHVQPVIGNIQYTAWPIRVYLSVEAPFNQNDWLKRISPRRICCVSVPPQCSPSRTTATRSSTMADQSVKAGNDIKLFLDHRPKSGWFETNTWDHAGKKGGIAVQADKDDYCAACSSASKASRGRSREFRHPDRQELRKRESKASGSWR